MVDTQTKLYALLGKPLGQSFSALMHNEAYRHLSLNCLYFPVESDQGTLEDIIRGIRAMNFGGFNVTKPYKVAIMQYLDGLDDIARVIGAVNTVKKTPDGKLIGYNTDGMGFVDSITGELDFSVTDKSYYIIGAGGAARAVAVTLAFRGAGELLISDIIPATAHTLVDEINREVRSCARVVGPRDKAALDACDCVINASGLGMYPHPERTPLPKEWLRKELTVVDLTYNPAKTQLLLDAEQAGCSILNGLGMLINQGGRAFEIWLDIPAPVEVMRAAILKEINRTGR